jgi:hydroxymethylbilane synthase
VKVENMAQNSMDAPVRIGTRGSPLALIQANYLRDGLIAANAGLEVEIMVIRTSGDRITDRPLAEVGGKGLFTKEIEEALFDDRIDLAVHSMKDVETWTPDGLMIDIILEREDPRDGFIGRDAARLADLPSGAIVGTSSLRRQAQVLAARPDVKVESIRGNVETRLRKLQDGECDATLLAVSGLNRLGKADVLTSILNVEEMLPAVAQGAVGVEIRANDDRLKTLLAPLNHKDTALCISAERAMLAALDGSCRTPIAALAELGAADILTLTGLVASPDGTVIHRQCETGSRADAIEMGAAMGAALKSKAGPNLFEH